MKCPEEAYLDSALFRTVNAQYMDETKKLALVQNNHFDLDEFALKMGGGCVGLSHKSRNLAQKWVNFGRKMTRHFHPAPAVEYLYGAVDTGRYILTHSDLVMHFPS